MKLVFLYGPPAVGKLTVARELAKLNGFRLFHNHLTVDLLTSLFPFGTPPFIRLREEIWLAAFAEAARENVSLIFTFNPERSVSHHFIRNTEQVVEMNGGTVVFVELTCAETELEQRMEAESRKQYGKLASVALYRNLKNDGAFEFPKLPAELSIDTSNNPPAATAKLIAEYLA